MSTLKEGQNTSAWGIPPRYSILILTESKISKN
jgi:hypothetical protein